MIVFKEIHAVSVKWSTYTLGLLWLLTDANDGETAKTYKGQMGVQSTVCYATQLMVFHHRMLDQ